VSPPFLSQPSCVHASSALGLSFYDRPLQEDFNDQCFAFRTMFVPKIVSKKGQADCAIEFIRADPPEAQSLVETGFVSGKLKSRSSDRKTSDDR
jgi:hypothetical protein